MRLSPTLLTLTAALAVLGACSKKPAAPEQATAPAAPEAAAPTADQAKAILATLPAQYAAADLVNGKQKFAQCAACHTITQGGPNMTGPNLWGVFGRRAGTEAGYDYSDAVKAAGFTWDAAHIDTWITNPQAMIPGTKMTFIGLKDPKDRTDVIAYVKVNTTAVK